MNDDLYNLIIDYMYVSRKFIEFIHNVVTKGGEPVAGLCVYLNNEPKLSYCHDYIGLINTSGQIEMGYYARNLIKLINLRGFDLSFADRIQMYWKYACPAFWEKNAPIKKYYKARDDIIRYVNACIEP